MGEKGEGNSGTRRKTRTLLPSAYHVSSQGRQLDKTHMWHACIRARHSCSLSIPRGRCRRSALGLLAGMRECVIHRGCVGMVMVMAVVAARSSRLGAWSRCLDAYRLALIMYCLLLSPASLCTDTTTPRDENSSQQLQVQQRLTASDSSCECTETAGSRASFQGPRELLRLLDEPSPPSPCLTLLSNEYVAAATKKHARPNQD